MPILVLISTIFMIVMTQLSNSGFFGGRTIEQFANTDPNILVPAGRTFAIRGPIYLGIIVFSFVQLFNPKIKADTVISSLRPRIISNVVANGLWLPAATIDGRLRATVPLIFWMWISLAVIVKELFGRAHSNIQKRTVTIPFSIYFARITIATPLNIASLISSRGATVVVQAVLRVVVRLGIGIGVSILIFKRLRYLSFILVTVRALCGVIAARAGDATLVMRIAIVALMGILRMIIHAYRHKKLIFS
jgi:hypothetical protein